MLANQNTFKKTTTNSGCNVTLFTCTTGGFFQHKKSSSVSNTFRLKHGFQRLNFVACKCFFRLQVQARKIMKNPDYGFSQLCWSMGPTHAKKTPLFQISLRRKKSLSSSICSNFSMSFPRSKMGGLIRQALLEGPVVSPRSCCFVKPEAIPNQI